MLLDLIPPSLRPYAKAVAPRAAAILVLLVDLVRNGGQIDKAALEIAVVAFIAASVTFWTDQAPDGWRRYAKALAPAALTLAGVAVHALVAGVLDDTTLRIAAAGLGAALLALIFPNDTGVDVKVEPVDEDDDDPVPLLPGEHPDVVADRQRSASELAPPLTPEDRP